MVFQESFRGWIQKAILAPPLSLAAGAQTGNARGKTAMQKRHARTGGSR